jgi:outer membrane usher protein
MARSHYLSGRLGTSLMFADGLWGIGRPVNEGFVLVNGQHELDGTGIRLNPSEEYSSEFSHNLGPISASYGDLGAYRQDQIKIKLESPPAGVFLENGNFKVSNTYKQGYALRLGMPPSVFIRLRIVDESGQGVSYTTFQIFEKKSNKQLPIVQSFTNKNGVLQAPKLEPGKTYIIQFGADAFIRNLEIKIPEKARGIKDFGDVKVNHEVLASKLAALHKK